jgi:hypothetical protein
MNKRADGLPFPYPLMAVYMALCVFVPLTIVGVMTGMLHSPWYLLLTVLIVGGGQVSLYIVKRLNEAAAQP